MYENEERPAKTFTVEQANAMLPLVRQIARDVVTLSNSVLERQERLEHLTSGREMSHGDPYEDELAQIQQELDKDSERLRGFVGELVQLGVEPKSVKEGLIDFPSMMDGRLVYLCWKYNEPEVQYWHEVDAGFAGRQALTAAVGVNDISAEGFKA